MWSVCSTPSWPRPAAACRQARADAEMAAAAGGDRATAEDAAALRDADARYRAGAVGAVTVLSR